MKSLKKIYSHKFVKIGLMLMVVLIAYSLPAFAATDVWSKAEEVMKDVYGKVVAIESRKLGINANNEMVVDIPSSGNMPCGTVMRGFGGDIHNTARLAVAMARGLRDGGVLPPRDEGSYA